jgi:hypothetical protein
MTQRKRESSKEKKESFVSLVEGLGVVEVGPASVYCFSILEDN